MKTLSVGLYARVSTLDRGQNPEMQLRELREYCDRRGWKIAGEYVDNGVSGSKESRPQLNRLMADAGKRKFDVVCVWRFDRFARSTTHLLRGLETFRSLGIEFCSLRESIDTLTPAGKMMFTVIAALSEFERSLICERVKSGIAHRRSKGLPVGRKAIMLDASKLAGLRSEGRTIREIAATLGCSRSLVHKTLQISA